jgi:hypothetical protein
VVAYESSAVALADLRHTRQRKRIANIHWVDALYHVYLAAIFGIVGVVVVSNLVGGDKVTGAQLHDVLTRGPALLGLAGAVAVLVGLRSGSRGGPIALEGPDVRHVLLSPVDRLFALRGPALRQLRFVAVAGAVTGGVAAVFAHRRLDLNPAALIACGAGFGLTVACLGIGCALLASGRRIPSWASSLIGVVLVAWGIADALGKGPTAPSTFLGRLPLWPLHFDVLAIIPVVVALAVVVVGLRGLGGISLEKAERRTNLVGQLRFAVTLQDLRTVLVLRRQLGMELPRVDPWFGGKSNRHPRFVVWARDWRGIFRWPVTRLVRLALLAVIAGVSMRAVWQGTVPLIVLAGLAMWVAGLDAIEPLAQETDHPSRRDAYPLEEGEVMVRHLAAPALVMVLVALLAGVVAVAVDPSTRAVQIAAISVIPAGLMAVAGAVVSTLMGAPKLGDAGGFSFAPPEFAGMKNAMRTAWPPALAIAGTVPTVVARALVQDGKPFAGPTIAVAVALVGVFILSAGWVRFRADIHQWWTDLMAEAQQAQKSKGRPTLDDSGTSS